MLLCTDGSEHLHVFTPWRIWAWLHIDWLCQVWATLIPKTFFTRCRRTKYLHVSHPWLADNPLHLLGWFCAADKVTKTRRNIFTVLDAVSHRQLTSPPSKYFYPVWGLTSPCIGSYQIQHLCHHQQCPTYSTHVLDPCTVGRAELNELSMLCHISYGGK